ncbi:MAG: histidinol-phosphatase HisJ family protein [Eubacteriales bacterium]
MYDYHSHTSFSDDSSSSFEDMLDAACNLGLKELAITDHYDPDYPDKEFPFDLDFGPYNQSLVDFGEKYRDKIKLIKGIEIGIQKSSIDKCKIAATSFDYDFIIGSFHCAQGKELYGLNFFTGKSPFQAYVDFYGYVYDCLKNFNNYSILGHINIIDRYAQTIPAFSFYSDEVDSILRLLIENGKGIEINTSSYRYGMGDLRTPSDDILKRYKQLGGEILTLGSDAHFPEHIAYKFKSTLEYLQYKGFKYLTTFDNLIPSQVGINS